jgi:hypothetical protein
MRKAITVVVAVALAGVLAAVVFAGTVNGTAKNDTLRGSGKADSIYGRAGNDKLYGLGGNDKLIGGPANDLLVGGAGADSLDCGPGTDSAQADDLDKVSPSCESVKGVTPPAISISDASVVEGNSGTATLSFTVVLSKAANKPTSVSYATADGTATAPADYASAGSTLVFNVGERSKTVTVSVVGELLYEPDETLTVALSSPVAGKIADGSATGTIRNDDTPAIPGHYSGKTSQNETFDFDVTSAGTAITSLRTGQINQSCSPPAYISGGRLDFGSNTYPIAADASFTIDVTYPGTVSGGGQTATTTTHVVIAGRFAGQTASGTLIKTLTFTLFGTNYTCTSNPQTWNVTRA